MVNLYALDCELSVSYDKPGESMTSSGTETLSRTLLSKVFEYDGNISEGDIIDFSDPRGISPLTLKVVSVSHQLNPEVRRRFAKIKTTVKSPQIFSDSAGAHLELSRLEAKYSIVTRL